MLNAVIVGATSGIGRALADVLVAEGYRVGATGRRDALLREVADAYPGRVVMQAMDLREPEAAMTALERLIAKLGGMDVLVIAAGIGARNPELDFGPEARVAAVNVVGFMAMATAGYHYFARHGGHLVGISSVAALRGSRWSPSYSASKAFMRNYLEALRARARHDRLPITVTEILPGFVATPMTEGQQGMFWVADTRTAAAQILAAIKAKRRRAYITRRWGLVAWLLRHLPDWALERL
ncbi:MAG TPA: SDR family NAD(P)-dependent oxidoreductase [Armatimonadota bacterium]|nr:SDR family NAD(P)-dependent oxidoreductase [Armatimonadota bacterium]